MSDDRSSGSLDSQPDSNVSFRTRARTIDHLGRGQIADAPTAVSELWKNAWDAYANQVSLNIFDGEPVVAAVFDDGVGMSAEDIVGKWLVIGTESKADGPAPEPPASFRGRPRPRQGEKGIGRLSAAFLAPATLVLSKQSGGRIAAILVDWRLFENPYLSLDQIVLPVRSFADRAEVLGGLRAMMDVLVSNLGERSEDGTKSLRPEWDRFSEAERKGGTRPTAETISSFWTGSPIAERHLDEWPVLADLTDSGTALYLLGAHHELSLYLSQTQDEEAKKVKERFRDILTGFTDRLTTDPADFAYEVLTYRGSTPRRVLASSDVFDLHDFRELEHSVEGTFDEEGVFRGTVKAFGEVLGERVIPPPRPLPSARSDRPGPFSFSIGTFEQTSTSSTHGDRRHKELMDLVKQYGGVRVYRDDLRVMPYGSAEADFFSLEETRQKHAGRYFWAHRRSFGRLAFTRAANPALRDKAGREGLVENRASRELRLLVRDLLLKLAADYFGTDAPDRTERINEARKRNAKGKQAADEARKRRESEFKTYLGDAVKRMPRLSQLVDRVSASAEEAVSLGSREAVAAARAEFEQARLEADALTPAHVPARLGRAEQSYRSFRDDLDKVRDLLADSDHVLRGLEVEIGAASPAEMFDAARARHKSALDSLLDRHQALIRKGVDAIASTWTPDLADDRARYERETAPLKRDVEVGRDLADTLVLLENIRQELESEFDDRYGAAARNMAAVATGLDAEAALTSIDEEREDLDRRLRDLNAVAQLGITVEIIGHELEDMDGEVSRNFDRMPASIKSSIEFKRALDAHRSLTQKLRFLSPLHLAGSRVRESITGAAIADYVRTFFGTSFEDSGITFESTTAFDGARFTEMRSRIYPVFINLVNNSIYWVGRSENRRIRLDLLDGQIVVGDSGPGVDKDDVENLFQLFYTRRPSGRGVGLYLARVNLEAGRHSIRYAADDDPRTLPGANFVLRIRGLVSGN